MIKFPMLLTLFINNLYIKLCYKSYNRYLLFILLKIVNKYIFFKSMNKLELTFLDDNVYCKFHFK